MSSKSNPEAIGITEGGDPALNPKWEPWIRDGKPAVLITKNPAVVLQKLKGISQNPRVILHCTITGWGSTPWEPNVPPPLETLNAYQEAIQWLGPKKVVLRIDPIYPSDEGRQKALETREKAGSNARVRISFLDLYPHVLKRMAQRNLSLPSKNFHADFNWRKETWELLGKPEICAEPNLPGTPCVGATECEVLGIKPLVSKFTQRPLCSCLYNKVELLGVRHTLTPGLPAVESGYDRQSFIIL
jgi:hypothetical protein